MTDEPKRGWRLVLARRTQARTPLPASVRRFARRARRRRLRAALPWLIGLGVLALIAGGVGVVYRTSLFGVSTVQVIGGPADEVRLFAAVPPGTPLAGFDKAALRRRVMADPEIRTVAVLRRFPSTLIIEVTLRHAVAAVPVVDGAMLVDGTGVAFRAVRTPPPDLPVVRLADPSPDDLTTRAALTVLAALPPQVRTLMIQLEADAPTRIRLDLTGGRTFIWGDDTDNPEKVRVLTTLLASPGGDQPATWDISAPSVVAVR